MKAEKIDFIHFEDSGHWYDSQYWFTDWSKPFNKLDNRIKVTNDWEKMEMLRNKINELVGIVNGILEVKIK